MLRLSNIMGKIPTNTVITIKDYLSNEVYLRLTVEETIYNSLYLQQLKGYNIYGISVYNNELIVDVLLD